MFSRLAKMNRRRVAMVLGLVLAGGAVWWLAIPGQPEADLDIAAIVERDDTLEQPRQATREFLGPQACAECHDARVAEFQDTRHARACRTPSAEIMPAGYDAATTAYRTRFPEWTIEVGRAGDAFFQTALRTTPQGEKRTKSAVALIYGSGGKADEIYFAWRGDGLHELPLAWLHPLQAWGESPFSRHLGDDFTRVTTPRCLECHNTWFAHEPGTTNHYDREHFILGVTCERCHGPAQEHVAFHRANPDATAAKAIVRPDLLSRARQLDVCGQCHSNASKHRRPPFSYRPGEPLEDYYRVASIPHREDDRVADQVKYLSRSKCFTQSDSLTCTTCHDPHRPDQAAVVRRGCFNCHEPESCADRLRLPEPVRDRCVDCHMPRFTRIQVHFHTASDRYVPVMRPAEHQIGVYPHAKQETLLQWRRGDSDATSRAQADLLADALVKHWHGQAERYREEHRFLAAIGALREALRIRPDEPTRAKLDEVIAVQSELDSAWDEALAAFDQRRFDEALPRLHDVLKMAPTFFRAHARLGTLHAAAGRREPARKHLQIAAKGDPEDPYAFNMLGWMAYLDGQGEGAIEAFRQADALEPHSAEIQFRWGLAALSLGRAEEAADRFARAVAVNPKHAGAYQGRSHALRQQGRAAEAVPPAARAVRLTDFENADMLLSLADAYAGVGRRRDAVLAATRAVEAAERNDPKMVESLRDRLRELQRDQE